MAATHIVGRNAAGAIQTVRTFGSAATGDLGFTTIDGTVTGSITSTQSVTLPINAAGNCRFSISGTWTGVVQFEITTDNSIWVAADCLPVPIGAPALTAGGAIASFATVNGDWEIRTAGVRSFRVRGLTVLTGSATVTINSASGSSDYVVARVVDDGYLSSNNSTSAPLGIGGVFTGTAVDLQPFPSFSIYALSNVASATNGLVIQFSADSVTWFSEIGVSVLANNPHRAIYTRRARYFRLAYTNGAVGQTTFQLQVYLQRVATPQNTITLNEVIYSADTGTLTRSVLTGLNPSGTYSNVSVSNINALSVAGSGTSAVAASAWTSATAGDTAINVITNDYTINSINLSFTTTATITGGAITFEGTVDGTNWVGIIGSNASTQTQLASSIWTITTGTLVFAFNVTGFNYFRYRLSTVIAGTGTCTGTWITQALTSPSIQTTINQSGSIKVTGDQGVPNTIGNSWPMQIVDGTRGPATVKAASTAAIATDLAMVVAVSPNNTVTTQEVTTTTPAVTQVASSATNVTLLASAAGRRGSTVYNASTAILYLKLGATASATSYTTQVAASGYYEVPFGYTGIIDGIWAAANGFAYVTSLT